MYGTISQHSQNVTNSKLHPENTMAPKVSVCIPTYNGEPYLNECLESVLQQTHSDFEVIIVDDQSSDKTLGIARSYANKDQRIKIYENPENLGLVGNWNQCVELAKGEWIKFVFQDDLITKDCLEKMVAASKVNDWIVSCRRDFILDEEVPEKEKNFFQTITMLDDLLPNQIGIKREDFCKTILQDVGHNYIGEPTCVMINRGVFSQFGRFNSNLIQLCDFEFFARVAAQKGIAHIPESLATFRVHGKSTTSRNHASKQYQTRTLDPLVLIHEFTLSPLYAPIRRAARELSKPLDLLELLSEKARNAWKETLKNPEYVREWEKITDLYPALGELSKRSLSKRLFHYVGSKNDQISQKLETLLLPHSSTT
jgi:glycosyltransferase involved in cell wall biosynthesis